MTEDDGELVALEVELPSELLSDIDEYAVRNGYENPGAVVQKALQQNGE